MVTYFQNKFHGLLGSADQPKRFLVFPLTSYLNILKHTGPYILCIRFIRHDLEEDCLIFICELEQNIL